MSQLQHQVGCHMAQIRIVISQGIRPDRALASRQIVAKWPAEIELVERINGSRPTSRRLTCVPFWRIPLIILPN
ncbi:hypothetical protein EG849_15345 [Flavobacterium macacae]|uniref:Uncharacterized protein n=1 Tax=Flavobacterium macacae TaxID=2488993 RepID=A0A3P3VZ91_9FLAO|nr:hypothetical protein EG849_15345 [Flavobacterium macacae]